MMVGHQKQWQFLKKSAELGKITRAFLFSGQEKLGKKTLALEWVSSLFGEKVGEKPQADFVLIESQGKEIQISQIRELIWKLSLKPFAAPFKAAIIDQAHLMNQEAQNCFLKTLEEPKGQSLLILISEAPERLLPTILSRCEVIKFYPVAKNEIKNYLKNQGLAKEEVEEFTALSLGKPGVAVDLTLSPQKLENQKKIIKELIKISKSDLASRFQYAKELSQGPDLRETLNIWLNYFRETLLSTLNNQQSPSSDLAKLKNILQKIQNTHFLISTTNVNPRLALEILMLEL